LGQSKQPEEKKIELVVTNQPLTKAEDFETTSLQEAELLNDSDSEQNQQLVQMNKLQQQI
jgi:hypothetical protein